MTNLESYDLSVMSADNVNQDWKMPAELEQPLPRRVRLNLTGIASCLIAIASITVGVGLTYRLVDAELRRETDNHSLALSLAADGRETQATVTRLATTLGHVVNYQFTINGQTYSKGAFISQEHWQALQVGSPVAILYLPSDPSKSFPKSDSPISQTHWLVILPAAGLILFIFFGFAYAQLSTVLPERRLLTRGRSAPGVVTRCNPGSRGRRSGYFVHYEFPLADGAKGQGRDFSSQPIAQNSTVTVLFDPDRPRRSTLYPSETARLAMC